ncbi:MAG: nitroreductase family protein [Gammaproteobacteria bacterium]
MPTDRKADTAVAIHPLIAGRWSPRAIDPDKPVNREQITAVLEAGRWAPSCFGDEPWRFLVFDQATDSHGWDQAFECLAEGNQAWVKNAPLLIAAVAGSRFGFNSKPNRWAQYDTGAASENLCLQASALGLVAHQMGGFDGKRLAERFDIPEEYTPMAMIAIGHPGDPADLPEALREKEQAPRQRQPLDEIAFSGRWSESYKP